MATKKSKEKVVVALEPVVTRGSHSTRIQYPNGRVEFETHWDELVRDVNEALAEFDAGKSKTTTKKTADKPKAEPKKVPAKKTATKKAEPEAKSKATKAVKAPVKKTTRGSKN